MNRAEGRFRFQWAALEDAGWSQLPLPPGRRPAWLDGGAGLAAAVIGGLLWRSSDGAPFVVRAGQVLAWWAVVAYPWFHVRQLTMRRLPSATLWPAALAAIALLWAVVG